jgi:hypothetical protein
MNATTALAMAFLDGKVLTIKTAFRDFGITNLPRECGRLIERKFNVQLVKVRKTGVTRYNIPCSWFEYRLPTTDYNKEGRAKMEEYVIKRVPTYKNSSGTSERQQLNLL